MLRRRAWGWALVLLLIGGGWLTLASRAPLPLPSPQPALVAAVDRDDEAPARPGPAVLAAAAVDAAASPDRAARRERILRARAERAAAGSTPAGDSVAAPEDEVPDTEDPVAPLTDRIGDRPYLAKVLSSEIMPLVDECLAQAADRGAELGGMLAVGFEVVADPQEGGIVDSAEVTARNEVEDPQLLECVQQTVLSAVLPPPTEGGREKLEVTIPTGEDAD